MAIKIFSFFSGAGFLDLGFEDSGFEISFVNEFHKPFLNAYKYSRCQLGYDKPEFGYSSESIENILEELSSHKIQDAISETRKNGDLVGFIGGPPCPDFSVGGKNKGRLGENGKLSQVYIELICRLLPDFFLFENVKGLWRTKRHRNYFDEMREQLKNRGYRTEAKLLNSISYGVAQDRDRIILIGINNDLINTAFEDHNPFPWSSNQLFLGNTAFDFEWPKTNEFAEDSFLDKPNHIPLELTVQNWFSKNNTSDHPNSKDHFVPRSGLPKFQTIQEGDDSKKSSKRLHRWRYSPTAAYGNNEVHLHPYKARRISAAEALAIQSLPKNFCLPPEMTLSDKFKTIGNGVPYLMSAGIAKSLRGYLEKNLA